MKRRAFIKKSAIPLAMAGVIPTLNFFPDMKKKTFVHHVYFWLKNTDSAEDRSKLIEGLKILAKVPMIRTSHIGLPAPTNRSVIDSSYAVSWLCFFDDLKDQEIYQDHPIHLEFIANCASLWDKVVVYDSIDID